MKPEQPSVTECDDDRRPYRTPTLTLHGSLKDLVRGGGSDVFDGTFASGGGSFGPPLPPRPPD